MGNRLEFNKKVAFNKDIIEDTPIKSNSIVDLADAVLAESKNILKSGTGVVLSYDDNYIKVSIDDAVYGNAKNDNLDKYIREVIDSYLTAGKNIALVTNTSSLSIELSHETIDSSKIENLDKSIEDIVTTSDYIDSLVEHKVNEKINSGIKFKTFNSSHNPLFSTEQDPSTGFYFNETGKFGFSVNGTSKLELDRAFAKFSTSIDMQNIYFIGNVPDPINDHHAVNKRYVDKEIDKLLKLLKNYKLREGVEDGE